MTKIYDMILNIKNDERGLTAVEYAVLGAIVVAAIGAAGTQFKTQLVAAFANLFG